jgi:CRISPR-associated endonuclease Cas1
MMHEILIALLEPHQWFRIKFSLVNERYNKDFVVEHIVSIVNSIIKSVSVESGFHQPVFHLNREAYSGYAFDNTPVEVTVLLSGHAAAVEKWLHALQQYFDQKTRKINFRLVTEPTIEVRNIHQCMAGFPELLLSEEYCLDFIMPLPLYKGRNDLHTLESLLGGMSLRFSSFFGVELNIVPELLSGIKMVSHTQFYTRGIEHKSKSSGSNQKQWLQGFTGPIYLSGELGKIAALVALFAEFHAGAEISNSMGYYILHTEPMPFMDRLIANEARIRESVVRQSQESDYFDQYVQGFHTESECMDKTCADMLHVMTTGAYHPQPANTFTIAKSNGGERTICQLTPLDELIQHFLFENIEPAFSRLLENSAIGFRKGSSRLKSVAMVEQAVEEGFHFVVHTDIDDYFPSIDHDRLSGIIDALLPLSDTHTATILKAAVATPTLENGRIQVRKKGLAQGSSLSPLLANLYLDSFDEFVATLPAKLIRYADDLLLMCKSEEEAREVLLQVRKKLKADGLKLNEEKTFVRSIADDFEFLGIRFYQGKSEAEDPSFPLFRKKPLYAFEPYSLMGYHKGTVQIKTKGKLNAAFPLSSVSEIITTYQNTITGVLIDQCLRQGIPITLSLSSAYHLTTIKPNTKTYHDIMTRHGMVHYQTSEMEKLMYAKEIATAKFRNLIPLFAQRHDEQTTEIIRYFESGTVSLGMCQTIDEVRGHEGRLTREFYRFYNALIEVPEFRFERRDRLAADPMNALLNYSSYLMMTKLNSIVRAQGLNPYLGFLHSELSNYESLVYDLIEPFRGRLYRFLLRVVHLKMIAADDFEFPGKGAWLKPEARRKFTEQFEKELNRIDPKTRLTLREHLYAQVVIVKNWVQGNGSLYYYQWLV